MFGVPWFHFIVAPPRARIEGMRERLLRAAEGLLREEGLQAVTLEAVARRAHAGRGAPRYHFGGRQGLLEALAARQHPRVRGRRRVPHTVR
ncbi:transcriptional regulator, TetR family [Myxococcus fulvus]|uniref:Transcriptional regulator, TetR family n=1 Tax=Myxococcus fulvus TaxID=33 RepID=A0A511TFT0_MYXFU|nr:helix-turn-helix domain-containing protein [Myxococcus fulvus]AKF85129.1 hypothetical protein MFUL124B02_09805 [Myxococcus fulvus 124B02]GEN13020.1 hypothetical protein MFU01_80570 [Myxococcus fulvus]SEU38302.1 transcriptional regulator, TetR family [Myxococcus fulvus]